MDERTIGAMTVREAGKRGGIRVKKLYGHDFFVKIGRKGGQTSLAKLGPLFYSYIGKKGGVARSTKRARG